MLRARSLFLPICALMLATVGSAGAQEFRATVKGQVVDTSDAALPGATVTVQNQDTNEIATADHEHRRRLHRSRSCGPASTP